MQDITPPTVAQLLAPGQVPLMKFELYFPDNRLGTMNFDSGSVEPQVNEILTGATSGATAKVFSVNRTGGTWAGTNASGSIELRDCSGCFNDDENINGSVGGANILTVNHPDGIVGVDKLVKNGAFAHDVDPPNDWTAVQSALLTTEAGGGIGNCIKVKEGGANNPYTTQDIPVSEGHIYKLSFWHKDIDGTTTNPNWSIRDNSAPAWIVNWTTETANAAWTQVIQTFETPPGCSEIRICLMHSALNGDADAYYFDEVSLYELEEWINLCDLDSKNYVEDWSISLGGASMTPNPIGGKWNATLFNEDGIFHPQHPTSAYAGYCVTGREVRISIGATYGGVDYYWQRIIGYMDEPKFSAPDYRVNISGGDYMKMLEDAEFQELDVTYPNHWGLSTTFDSWPSDGLVGGELYAEADAMEIGAGEADNVTNWVATNCTFVSLADVGGGSDFVGRMTAPGPLSVHVKNLNVGAATTGKEYRVKFKHRAVGGDGTVAFHFRVRQGINRYNYTSYFPTDAWKEETIFFTALQTAAIEIWIWGTPQIADLRLDQFSIFEYIPEVDRYYDLTGADANQKGPYHVTYDDGGGAVPVQQGEEDEGWYYEEATGRVFFDRNKTVIDGAGNIVVYYYTATDPEDAVARILYFAKVLDPATGLPYADEAAALAAMDNDDPGFAIDKVWFKAGTPFLNAIRMLCERCNYRFYFEYDGTPVFKAVPAPGGADFTFTSPAHIASSNTYQSRSEIKNRIIIKGIKQAEPGNRDETTPSELTGEAHDDASIAAYGERTLPINNYLFQTQGPLDAMCATLLALYKDPKWYSDLKIPFNPVPLELVDDIQWELRLSPVLNITQTGVIRDIKIDGFHAVYKCEII